MDTTSPLSPWAFSRICRCRTILWWVPRSCLLRCSELMMHLFKSHIAPDFFERLLFLFSTEHASCGVSCGGSQCLRHRVVTTWYPECIAGINLSLYLALRRPYWTPTSRWERGVCTAHRTPLLLLVLLLCSGGRSQCISPSRRPAVFSTFLSLSLFASVSY